MLWQNSYLFWDFKIFTLYQNIFRSALIFELIKCTSLWKLSAFWSFSLLFKNIFLLFVEVLVSENYVPSTNFFNVKLLTIFRSSQIDFLEMSKRFLYPPIQFAGLTLKIKPNYHSLCCFCIFMKLQLNN